MNRYLIPLAVLLCVAAWLPPAGAASQAEWDQYNDLLKRVRPLEEKDPAKAAGEYHKYLRDHPMLAPEMQALVAFNLTRALYDRLHDVQNTLAILDYLLERHAQNPAAVVRLLQSKVRVLSDEGKLAEAEAETDKYLPTITQLRSGFLPNMVNEEALATKRVFWYYGKALAGQKKPDKLIEFTQKALLDYPSFLDEGRQYHDAGLMYDQLIQALVAADRFDEALGWAKLRFMLCAVDADAIERSTETLKSVWLARDLSEATGTAFDEAQKDAAKPNPLAPVKLPKVDADQLKALLARLPSEKPDQAHDRVGLMLLLGQEHQAMLAARRLFLADPKSPAGAQEMARVLKAGDLSVRRANALLDYVKTGAGENPVSAFLKEHPEEK